MNKRHARRKGRDRAARHAFSAQRLRTRTDEAKELRRRSLTVLLLRTRPVAFRLPVRRSEPVSGRIARVAALQGHVAGDAALRHVAAAITRSVRAVDAASRWGGDEFLVLAPQTALQDAAVLASRIRAAAATPVTGAPLVSVSIGIASVPPADSGPTLDELLQAADDALYEAKRAGGNQVGGAPERS
jgi:hypothetical protein